MSDVGWVLNDRACYSLPPSPWIAASNRQFERSKVNSSSSAGSRGFNDPGTHTIQELYIRGKGVTDGRNDREFTSTQPLRYVHLQDYDWLSPSSPLNFPSSEETATPPRHYHCITISRPRKSYHYRENRRSACGNRSSPRKRNTTGDAFSPSVFSSSGITSYIRRFSSTSRVETRWNFPQGRNLLKDSRISPEKPRYLQREIVTWRERRAAVRRSHKTLNEKRLFFLSPYDFLIMLAIYSYVWPQRGTDIHRGTKELFAHFVLASYIRRRRKRVLIDRRERLIFFSLIESTRQEFATISRVMINIVAMT